MGDTFHCIDKKCLEVQRHIYIADILNKHFVCSPSVLKSFPLLFLRSLVYSDNLIVLDFIDAYKRFDNSSLNV